MKKSRIVSKASDARDTAGTRDVLCPLHSSFMRWTDLFAELLLVALLMFTPLALGSLERWSEQVVLIACGVLMAVTSLRLMLSSKHSFVWSWTYLPLVLFLLFVVVQLVPLPFHLISWIAPSRTSFQSSVIGDTIPGSDTTLSLYPHATARALRLLLVPVSLFLVIIQLVRKPDQFKRILTAITIIGGAVATLALVQTLTGASEIYWTFPIPGGGVATGGPFVNRGHFAQFTNLSLGASIGLLLIVFREEDRGQSPAKRTVRRVDVTSAAIWAVGVVIVLEVVVVVLSQSRGGSLAVLIALVATVGLLGLRGGAGHRGPLLAAILLVAAGAAVYFGYDALHARFTGSGSDQYGDRQRILRDLVNLVRQFPAFGTGLGTFQFVFPMVDTATLGLVATHAENEYAQVLVETGILGLGIVLCFILAIGWHFARAVRSSLPVAAGGLGLGFGLMAAAIQSLSDFGQHGPAVGGLTAVFCGLLVCLTRMRRGIQTTEFTLSNVTPGRRFMLPMRSALGTAAMIGLTVAIGMTLPSADAARRAAVHWQRATTLEEALAADSWNSGTEEDYAVLIGEAAAASALEPRDISYRYALNALRWRAVVRFHESDTDAYRAYARRIVDELHKSRPLCPTYGPSVSLAGQIETFVLSDMAGPEHIRLGYRLAPTDAAVCLAAGRLEVREGQWPASLEALKRAVRIDGRLLPEALRLYGVVADRPDLAVALIYDNADELRSLADVLDREPEPGVDGPTARPELARQARERALELLRQRCSTVRPPANDLASLADMLFARGENAAAVVEYRRALASDFSQVEIRYRLAKALVASDRPAEALKELEACLRQRPGWSDAEQMAERLRTAVEGIETDARRRQP